VDMVKRGLVLDHSKSPCEDSFIPNKGEICLPTNDSVNFILFSNISNHYDTMFILKVVQIPCSRLAAIFHQLSSAFAHIVMMSVL
jgi:hypothetical protein